MASSNLYTTLVNTGLPQRDALVTMARRADDLHSTVALAVERGTNRSTHDLGNATAENTIPTAGKLLFAGARYLDRVIITASATSGFIYLCDEAAVATDLDNLVLTVKALEGTTAVECGFPVVNGLSVWHSTTYAGAATAFACTLTSVSSHV